MMMASHVFASSRQQGRDRHHRWPATVTAVLFLVGATGALVGCGQPEATAGPSSAEQLPADQSPTNPQAVDPRSTDPRPTDPRPTDTVRAQDLLITHRVEGQVAAEGVGVRVPQGEPYDVLAPGSLAESGDVLFTVDAEPIILLDGTLPAWRTMKQGSTGPDVTQLEAALVALGYDPENTVIVDDTFTSATAGLVRTWQDDVGATETGRVELGDVVFTPTPRLVEDRPAESGDVLALASPSRQIEWSESLAEAGTLAIGDRVSARMPDGSTVEATVTRIANDGDDRVATATAADDSVTAEAMRRFDSFDVDVSWSVLAAENALTVPTGSITRLEGGVNAIEVVADDGSTRFIPVTVGPDSQGRVVIEGDVRVGATVVAP